MTTENTTTETTETTKFKMSDLKTAILNFVNAALEIGNFDDEPMLDEKGKPVLDENKKPVMTAGGAFVAVKEFAPFDALKALAAQISETNSRGLPLDTRLANAQTALGEHYASVTVVDGKPQFSDEWQAKTAELTAKVASLKAQIKRAAKPKTESAGA